MAEVYPTLQRYAGFLERDILYSLEDLDKLGISRMAARRMVATGLADNPAHGLYIRSDYEPHILDDHCAVAKRCPEAVFNLFTAAKFHGITQTEPFDLWIGIPHANAPAMGENFLPDLKVLRWLRPDDMETGVVTVEQRGVRLKFTDPARTVVDMWRYSGHNPSLNSRFQRVTDEELLQCIGAYLDRTDGAEAELGDVADKVLKPRTREAFGDFVRNFAGGYSHNRVF